MTSKRVGSSGAPTVYITVGISGAHEHAVGMRRAKNVLIIAIAIETDADELIDLLAFETGDQSLHALDKAKKWGFQYLGDFLSAPSVVYRGNVVITTQTDPRSSV